MWFSTDAGYLIVQISFTTHSRRQNELCRAGNSFPRQEKNALINSKTKCFSLYVWAGSLVNVVAIYEIIRVILGFAFEKSCEILLIVCGWIQ